MKSRPRRTRHSRTRPSADTVRLAQRFRLLGCSDAWVCEALDVDPVVLNRRLRRLAQDQARESRTAVS